MLRTILTWKVLLVGIILLAAFLRLWQLDKVPTGISDDELNFIINAKAIFYTGKNIAGNWSPFSLTPITGEFAQAELPYLIMAPFVGPFDFSLLSSKFPYAAISILQVLLLFLIVSKLIGRNEALIVAIVASLNPWSIFFGRTAYEAPLALFFYLLAFYILLMVRKWYMFFAFIPLFLGFYSYMGTKLIFIPYVFLISAYCWYFVYKKKYFTQLALLSSFCIALFIFFILSVQSNSANGRLSELSTPLSSKISIQVDHERKLSIATPLTKIFSNKMSVWTKESAEKYLRVFSTNLLFINGEGRSTFSLWYHGYFYHLDLLFLLIGFYALSKRKKSVFFLLLSLILIAPLPTVASSSETGFAALRSVLLYPLFIIVIGVGIWYVISFSKNLKYRLLVSSVILFLYVIHLLNFMNIYFFRNPIYNSEAYNLSSRLLVKYISLAEQHGRRVVIIANSGKDYIKQYLFYTNTYNKENSQYIISLFQNNRYAINNVAIATCSEGIIINPNDIIITNGSGRCKSTTLSKNERLTMPLLADGGKIFNIVNDSICTKYNLGSFPSNFSLSNFAIESLDEKTFCEKFITR